MIENLSEAREWLTQLTQMDSKVVRDRKAFDKKLANGTYIKQIKEDEDGNDIQPTFVLDLHAVYAASGTMHHWLTEQCRKNGWSLELQQARFAYNKNEPSSVRTFIKTVAPMLCTKNPKKRLQ